MDPSEERSAGLTEALSQWLRARGRVAIGFSGGVDSAYLAVESVRALGRDNVLAIIGRSASYPAEQWAVARSVADRFGLHVLELDTAEMSDPRYAANPTNRCYFCKSELWGKVVPVARERGFDVVLDGTNADDLSDHRPGAQAAREHGIESPLATLGFTKDVIRANSHHLDIPTWSQPSSPCLSSRIPYGTSVTAERLRQVELAERALRDLGIEGDLRVRFHGDLARIEMAPKLLATWLRRDAVERIARAVRPSGFGRVAIDLRGFRSGSLNVLNNAVSTV